MCGSRKRTQDHAHSSQLQGEIAATFHDRLDVAVDRRVVTVLLAKNVGIQEAGGEVSPAVLKPGDWIVIEGVPLASGEWVANKIRVGGSGGTTPPQSAGPSSGHQH